MAKEKVPFELARPSVDTPVTRTTEIDHGEHPLNEVIEDVRDKVAAVDVNRDYDADVPNGLGYSVLVADKTFAQQVLSANTIYEIRYDYDLNNQTVSLPKNCILQFEGGSLRNGTLIGNNTNISASRILIFKSINIQGTWTSKFQADWFLSKWNKHGDSQLIDCHDELEHLFNCGARDIHFGSSKLYYTSQTIVINNLINITGHLPHTHAKTGYGATIQTNSNITLLHFRVGAHSFGDRLCINGISLVAGSTAILDKTTPIVKIETVTSSGLWGVHVDCVMLGNYAPSDRVSTYTLRGMTGVEIASTSAWISYVRIGGMINTFKGVYVHGSNWITDTELYGEMTCVQGGTFAAQGEPIIIRGTQQSVRYFAKDNKEAFWEGGDIRNYGYVWDTANGVYSENEDNSYTALRKFDCNSLQGDINTWDRAKEVYNPQNSNVDGHFVLGGLQELRTQEIVAGIPQADRFQCVISNNADFTNDPSEGLYAFDGLKLIANSECLFNLNTTIIRTDTTAGKAKYLSDNLPFPTDEYKRYFSAWDAVYTRYTGTIDSDYNGTILNMSFVHNRVAKASFKIYDSNDALVYEAQDVNDICNIKDWITPRFKFEVVFLNDKTDAYQKLPQYVRIPSFNFSVVPNKRYRERSAIIHTDYPTVYANFGAQYIGGSLSKVFSVQSPKFAVLDKTIVWLRVLLANSAGSSDPNAYPIDAYVTVPIIIDPANDNNCKVISPYAYSSIDVSVRKYTTSNVGDIPLYGILINSNVHASLIQRIDGRVIGDIDDTAYTSSTMVAGSLTYGQRIDAKGLFHVGGNGSEMTYINNHKARLKNGFDYYNTGLHKQMYYDTAAEAWYNVQAEHEELIHAGNNTDLATLMENHQNDLYNGYMFFNTQTKKPMWWRVIDAKWYDATGTEIVTQ